MVLSRSKTGRKKCWKKLKMIPNEKYQSIIMHTYNILSSAFDEKSGVLMKKQFSRS